MKEIEIKVKVINYKEIKEKLIKKFNFIKEIYNHDQYYYKNNKEVCRIRCKENNLILTKKYRSFNNGIEENRELQIELNKQDEKDLFLAIINEIDVKEVFYKIKKTELFKFEDLNIELNYIEPLNEHFLEIECLIDENDNNDQIKNKMLKILFDLGFNENEFVNKSYMDLIFEQKRKNDGKPTTI